MQSTDTLNVRMGFEKADYEKMKEAGVSNTQIYKQTGNSIVVNVLLAIYRKLYIAMAGAMVKIAAVLMVFLILD